MNGWRSCAVLAEGLRLLDAGEVRAAHEAFEDAWRARRTEPIGTLARALSQWAAACVHFEARRDAGFQSLAAKSVQVVAQAEIVRDFGTRGLAEWMTRSAADAGRVDPRAMPLTGD